MRIEDDRRIVLAVVAVERERDRAAVGVEARVGELLYVSLVDLQAGGVLGVEQRVEVPARHVALPRLTEVCLRAHDDAKVGHVVSVRVEDAAHGVPRQLDGPDDVGRVHVGESHYGVGASATRHSGKGRSPAAW